MIGETDMFKVEIDGAAIPNTVSTVTIAIQAITKNQAKAEFEKALAHAFPEGD